MAIVTETMTFAPAGRLLYIDITFDDARIGTDPDGTVSIDACALASVTGRCVVGPVFVDIRRGNGAAWLSVTLESGQSQTVNAGGPVRTVGAIPEYRVRAG